MRRHPRQGWEQFTPRQTVLFTRLEQLCRDAGEAEFFPINITAIRGGGSLFRLEPNPKDADLSIVYSRLQSPASLAFNRFFADFYEYSSDFEFSTCPALNFQSYMDNSGNSAIRGFAEQYSRWLGDASWASIDKHLEYVSVIEYMHGMAGQPIADTIASLLTRSMIRARYARLQIAELTRESRSTMKMNLTTIWATDLQFDPVAISRSAATHVTKDHTSLIPDYHRTQTASALYHEAIQLAIRLRNTATRKWPQKIAELAKRAAKALNCSQEVELPKVEIPAEQLRKTVKALRNRIEFQQRFLDEVMLYRTIKQCRSRGWPPRKRSLEQYLATHLFGRMGRQRTRSWLPFLGDEGMDFSQLIHEEQIRLKGKSEVPTSYLS